VYLSDEVQQNMHSKLEHIYKADNSVTQVNVYITSGETFEANSITAELQIKTPDRQIISNQSHRSVERAFDKSLKKVLTRI